MEHFSLQCATIVQHCLVLIAVPCILAADYAITLTMLTGQAFCSAGLSGRHMPCNLRSQKRPIRSVSAASSRLANLCFFWIHACSCTSLLSMHPPQQKHSSSLLTTQMVHQMGSSIPDTVSGLHPLLARHGRLSFQGKRDISLAVAATSCSASSATTMRLILRSVVLSARIDARPLLDRYQSIPRL